MLEGWKRQEKITSLKWGTFGFEDDEPDRPQFRGQLIPSYIDGACLSRVHLALASGGL